MTPFLRRSLLVLSLGLTSLASAQTIAAPPQTESPAATAQRRVQGLDRGVNLSGWYGGWGYPTPDHMNTYTTPADFAFIRASGLRYVRLCVDPVALTVDGYGSPASMALLARLDRSIDQILAAGLNVSITAFPRSDYKHALLTQAGADNLRIFWKFMAVHLAGRDPERVFFDLLNEPEIDDPVIWNALQASIVQGIRAIETRHTLIATGNRYDGVDELLKITPLADQNVVYTFHFYEPFPFTHQGATWSTHGLIYLKNIPYPAPPDVLAPIIAATTDPEARGMLTGYSAGRWDAAAILRRLTQARTWADANHVTIIANEFGAFRDTIAPAQRGVFLHDVRTAMETLHIPWAMWDYRGNFGMVNKTADGTIIPDLPIMNALGLTIPPASATPPAPAAGTSAGRE